jgi:hypothetical protein
MQPPEGQHAPKGKDAPVDNGEQMGWGPEQSLLTPLRQTAWHVVVRSPWTQTRPAAQLLLEQVAPRVSVPGDRQSVKKPGPVVPAWRTHARPGAHPASPASGTGLHAFVQ